jgi:predicted HTH transcriptional regulator
VLLCQKNSIAYFRDHFTVILRSILFNAKLFVMTQHELDVICRNGEGQEVEFKRNLNSDLSKELVAFANAGGGRIFIGIDDMLTNIDQAVLFLERNLRLAYEIKDIRRKEILEIPKDVLREAIINACAHRNYFEFGANVVVEIFDDRVDISNPGGLPKDLKPEYFGKRSVARNPLIVSLLHQCNYIEKAGTGIQRMRDGMRDAGLREPIFSFSGFFTVTFLKGTVEEKEETETYNRVHEPEYGLAYGRLERLYTLLRQIRDNKVLEINTIAEQLDTTTRSIRRDMELLEQFGWIISTGVTNNTSYFITKSGLEKIDQVK